MPDNTAGGWGSVVGPNFFPQIGQVVESGIANQQQQTDKLLSLQERQQQLQYQRQKEEQNKQRENEIYNLGQIKSSTDFDKYKTGEDAIDGVAFKQLDNLQNDLLTNHVHDDPAVLQSYIKQRINPILSWHNVAQNENKQAQSTLANVIKENPNISPDAAHNLLMTQLANNVLDKDPQTGITSMRPAQLIRPSNYADIFKNPQTIASVVNSTEPLNKFYSSVPKEPFHSSEFSSDKGFKTREKYSGVIIPGVTQVVPDANGIPTMDVSSQTVPGVKDSQGNPMKIVDNNLYTKIMGTSDPVIGTGRTQIPISPIGSSALKQWYNSPERAKADAAYQQANGKPLDPHTEDMLFRNYLYNDVKANVPHYISQDQAQVVPKPPNIHINIGQPAAVQPVYQEINAAVPNDSTTGASMNKLSVSAQNSIMQNLRTATGEKDLSPNSVGLFRENDGSVAAYRVASGGKVGNKIGVIDPYAIDAKVNTSQKQKQAIIKSEGKSGGMVTMVLPDGRTGNIPENSVSDFLKEHPNAKRQ